MIRIVYGFILMLITAVIEIILYFVFSPMFDVLRTMRTALVSSDNMYFTPGLQSMINFIWDSGWVWFVVFIVIYMVILVFVQLFLKEQRSGYY